MMKGVYVKPVINRLTAGMMREQDNSRSFERGIRTQIDGADVHELVAAYGSPLYVFSEKRLRQAVRQAQQAFASHHPQVSFSWSYKTNYLKAICAVMHQEGLLAEVVSATEYAMARNLGVPGEQIIFNGPHKSRAALERAVEEGAMINIDHLDELRDLANIAAEREMVLPVGLRVNLDAGIQPQWSRFGQHLESGQAMEAIRELAGSGHLRLAGLHCHLGTYILEPEAYGKQVRKLLELGRQARQEFGFRLEYLDIGGGFPSHSRLKGCYLPPDVAVPDMEEYARAVGGALHNGLEPGHFPRLFIESGRALVDEAGYLLTSVSASKRLPEGLRAYVLDAGVNLLPTTAWYNHNVELTREAQGLMETSVLYGPLCMNIDVVSDSLLLPPLDRGELLCISPVGAYNITQSMQFIHTRPAVIMVAEDSSVDLIRRAERLEDIQRGEALPRRLQMDAATRIETPDALPEQAILNLERSAA